MSKSARLKDFNPQNIIVKMPNWLGDAVMATPVIKDLRFRYPRAKIRALCLPPVAQMLMYDPHLTEVLSYKKPSGWIHRAEHTTVIDSLQLGEYDLGLLMTNSFSSAWWFWRGKVQNRIGFRGNFRSWLLTDPVSKPKNIEKVHLVQTYKLLLGPLGIPVSDTSPQLYLNADDRKFVEDFYKLNHIRPDDIVIGINPGAAYGSAKCWIPERFKEVTQKLLHHPNVVVLYFGDQSSAPLVNEICANMPARVINLATKTTLRELIALIGACSIFLTNDSGPMHIASALNVPLLALFGSTNEVKTGPYNGGKVIHKHVECSPCYKRVCPIDFRCMTRISSEEVYQELEQMIQAWEKK